MEIGRSQEAAAAPSIDALVLSLDLKLVAHLDRSSNVAMAWGERRFVVNWNASQMFAAKRCLAPHGGETCLAAAPNAIHSFFIRRSKRLTSPRLSRVQVAVGELK